MTVCKFGEAVNSNFLGKNKNLFIQCVGYVETLVYVRILYLIRKLIKFQRFLFCATKYFIALNLRI